MRGCRKNPTNAQQMKKTPTMWVRTIELAGLDSIGIVDTSLGGIGFFYYARSKKELHTWAVKVALQGRGGKLVRDPESPISVGRRNYGKNRGPWWFARHLRSDQVGQRAGASCIADRAVRIRGLLKARVNVSGGIVDSRWEPYQLVEITCTPTNPGPEQAGKQAQERKFLAIAGC